MVRDVTGRGFIHIKLPGRNPLVGLDAGLLAYPLCAFTSKPTRSLGNQNEGVQHRLPPAEEDHQEGVRELPYCWLPTLFLVHELQHQRFGQCQPELGGGPEVQGRARALKVCHSGWESSVSAPGGEHIGHRGSGWPDVPLAKTEKGQRSTNSNKHSVASGERSKHLFP